MNWYKIAQEKEQAQEEQQEFITNLREKKAPGFIHGDEFVTISNYFST